MICSACKCRNPIGNKFCRECGEKLAPPEGLLAKEEADRIERERLNERVAGLLSAAFTLAEQKRYDQALPLAREAALLLPGSTAAHSLLATLYEQTDQEMQAITEMERVLELNPESAADRVKLEQLRRGIHILPLTATAAGASVPVRSTEPPEQRSSMPYWLPFVAAGAVSAALLGVGVSILNSRTRQLNANRQYVNMPAGARAAPGIAGAYGAQVSPNGAITMSSNVSPVGAPAKGTLPPNNEVRNDPFASLGIPGTPSTTGGNAAASGKTKPSSSVALDLPTKATTSLPLPFRDALHPPQAESAPTQLSSSQNAPIAPIIAGPPPAGGDSGIQAATVSAAPPAAQAAGSTPARPPLEDGYIRITVGPPGSASRGAARGGGNFNGLSGGGSSSNESALTRARRLHSDGRYKEAASAYQEALASGQGSSGDLHQSLAECYHRLGSDGNARSEYHSAISAYDAQAASGRNAAAAQRSANACRAALEALGGE